MPACKSAVLGGDGKVFFRTPSQTPRLRISPGFPEGRGESRVRLLVCHHHTTAISLCQVVYRGHFRESLVQNHSRAVPVSRHPIRVGQVMTPPGTLTTIPPVDFYVNFFRAEHRFLPAASATPKSANLVWVDRE